MYRLARLFSFGLFALICFASPLKAELKVLFLGDGGHHQPKPRSEQLIPAMAKVGIAVEYTEDIASITPETLAGYDGLLLYANIDSIAPAQEAAILEYVANGGGFIPLHCASYCFRNSAAMVELIGAQFQRHGGEIFTTEIAQPTHPIMQGFSPFESWDETYIHTQHNERNRIVLEVRRQGDQASGIDAEPWTWVRTHGGGRVFYTAWGHDERTWGHPGFLNLVERGIRWACGDDVSQVVDYADPNLFSIPKMTAQRTDVAPFEFKEVGPKIPNYLAGERWGIQGEVITTMQKPLPPEESIKHYVTPENFHLELFVSEPQLQGKPIAMNWDHKGRLWVCETIDYPNELMPPSEGRDRIRICEDTDHDGKADKFTVFAEQLSIPTSIEFYRGGVVVQAGIETLYLRDNDGDDVADQRDVLISGWAMGDTHGGVSNFQYGLDNRYWAMQGYNNSKPKYAGGEHRGFRQGPFNFTMSGEAESAQVADLEFVRSTTNNSWGLGSSEEGFVFASTANRAPSFFVPIANRYYEQVLGWTPSLIAEAIAPDHYFKPITENYRQVDHHGGYTAGAGHALYTARNYPPSWWNRTAFVCGPTGHLVGTFVLNPEGASFRDKNAFNLVASDDEWAAPIMAEVGPDGNMWILDWYNYIVQHNPTPKGFETGKGNAYKSDLRDKTHGRIYRLVYDGDDGQPGDPVLGGLNPDEPSTLVAALSNTNRLWRRHAQRLLVERGKQDVVPVLVELLGSTQVDAVDNNPGIVHALWTLKGLGALEQADGAVFRATVALLSHPASGVRRNAALVLPHSEQSVVGILKSGILEDTNSHVSLAALLALADLPSSKRAGELVAQLSLRSSVYADRQLADALICAAARHSESFLSGVLGSEEQAALTERAAVTRIVAEHLARSGVNEEVFNTLLGSLSQSGSVLAKATFEGLAAGWPSSTEFKLSQRNEGMLVSILEKADIQDLGPMLRIGKQLGSEKLTLFAEKLASSLMDRISDTDLAVNPRVSAARELVSLLGESDDAIMDLLDVIDPQTPPRVASGIVRALGAATAPGVGEALVDAWNSMTPSLRADALAVLMARPSTTGQMLGAIEEGIISFSELSLDQKATLASHPDRGIRRQASRLLESAGSTLNNDRQQVIENYHVATHSTGDPALGKKVFTERCAICHKHSGEGKEIGPDLTGMAVHPKEELLTHILDPSRSVEGNYRRYTVLTLDGKIIAGMIKAESQTAIELIDAEGKTLSILREDVESIASSNKSMMPEGLEQQIDPTAMTDLLEFLTSKGKYVPLPLASVATAVSTKPLFSNERRGPDQMIFDDWGLKEFQGVPFQVVDPQGDRKANIVLLNGPLGTLPPKMPREVSLPCNMVLKSLHLLSGVSGWGFPYSPKGSTTMIIRLHYEDGQTEDHALKNGVHFADYIRKVDVPESTFAFALRSQQIRYLSIQPKQKKPVRSVSLVKGDDSTSPIVMAVTAEQFE